MALTTKERREFNQAYRRWQHRRRRQAGAGVNPVVEQMERCRKPHRSGAGGSNQITARTPEDAEATVNAALEAILNPTGHTPRSPTP